MIFKSESFDSVSKRMFSGLTSLKKSFIRLKSIEKPMNDIVLMAIENGGENLLYDNGGFFFWEELILHDFEEQLTACTKLSYNINILLVLIKFINFYNIRVILKKINGKISCFHRQFKKTNRLRISISFNIFFWCFSVQFCFGIIFIALFNPLNLWIALLTSPKLPFPMGGCNNV